MQTYIALLRGINVAGQKKIKMAELREILNKSFTNVQTYIQSGNIIVQSDKTQEKVKEIIQKLIQKHYNFHVPTIILEAKDIKKILKSNPYTNKDPKKQYFTILEKKPTKTAQDSLEQFPPEEYTIKNNVAYLYLANGCSRSKLSNNYIERKLKINTTTRNFRTMNKLLEMI
jgi:uncharacterized protein (DUF1697 family)